VRLSASHPVAADRDTVFDRLCDVDALLADLGLRSADLQRVDAPAPARVGSVWRGTLEMNGIARPVEATLADLIPPETLRIAAQADGLSLDAVVMVTGLSDTRSDLTVAVELRPLTLKGRVMVQALKLLRDKLAGKLQDRVGHLARHLERSA
jgi:hypothetical protein